MYWIKQNIKVDFTCCVYFLKVATKKFKVIDLSQVISLAVPIKRGQLEWKEESHSGRRLSPGFCLNSNVGTFERGLCFKSLTILGALGGSVS